MAMTPEQRQEEAKRYGQVVAKAWRDETFKQRLHADPAGVLREHGIAVPAGQQVRVVEDTDQLVHLPLRAKPRDLSDEQLDQVAGGASKDEWPDPPSAGPWLATGLSVTK